MKKAYPTRDELSVWLYQQAEILSDEDKESANEYIRHAQKHDMTWEVVWWAFQRRFDEDFNLRVCLYEGLKEWDL